MKPRHAAALALVGWVLMVPPVSALHEVEIKAPCGSGLNFGTFASVTECERERKEAQDVFSDNKGWKIDARTAERRQKPNNNSVFVTKVDFYWPVYYS